MALIHAIYAQPYTFADYQGIEIERLVATSDNAFWFASCQDYLIGGVETEYITSNDEYQY
jgi:hypothetical protein